MITEIDNNETIKTFKTVGDKLLEQCNNATIMSDEDERKGTDLGVLIQDALKRMEKERKELVKPFNDGVKKINNKFALLTEPLELGKSVLQKKLLAYKTQKKQKEEEARRKELELQEKLKQEAIALGIEEPEQALVEVTEVKQPISTIKRSELGTSFTKAHWTYEVLDESLVPREYLSLDSKKINNAIKNGIREIAGLRVYQSETVVFK